MSRACRFVRVVFIDDDGLIDAVRQPMHHGVFCHAGFVSWGALDDEIAILKWMHRKGVHVLQAATLSNIASAIPGKCDPFRLNRESLAQAVELERRAWPEQLLRVGKNGAGRVDTARKQKRAKRGDAGLRKNKSHSAAR